MKPSITGDGILEYGAGSISCDNGSIQDPHDHHILDQLQLQLEDIDQSCIKCPPIMLKAGWMFNAMQCKLAMQ